MSYAHGQYEVPLGVSQSIVPANPIAVARWSPGFIPHVVRAIAAAMTVQSAAAIITLSFMYRPTAGSAAGESLLGTLVIPIGALVGKVYYKSILTLTRIMPGGEVVVVATGAGTGSASISMVVEGSPEHPSNNPNAILSA